MQDWQELGHHESRECSRVPCEAVDYGAWDYRDSNYADEERA